VNGPRRPGLWSLIQFLIELRQARAWATIQVTIQRGEITAVHDSRSYKLETLPIRDRTGQAAIAAGGAALLDEHKDQT